MNRISVIVPIYNTIYYLDKCIGSILDQTYKEFELLLIDDGSNDGSEFRCDHYGSIDRRIRVIHQENHGLVYSRKIGCKEANGDYITFIDSDDWVDKDYLENIFGDLEANVELLVSNLIQEKDGLSLVIPGSIEPGVYSKELFEKYVVPYYIRDWRTGNPGIQPFTVGKVFVKKNAYNILNNVNDSITLGEDGALTYPYCITCKKIKIIEYAGYHWRIHDDSMSRGLSLDSFDKTKVLNEYFERTLSSNERWEILKPQLQSWIVHDFLIPAIKDVYDFELGDFLYSPPYELIEKGEKLVIYGAGSVGKSFVKAIKKNRYAEISGWVDKDPKGNYCGIQIERVDELVEMEFDKIVVAIYDREIFKSIKSKLNRFGIPDDKIIWKEYNKG